MPIQGTAADGMKIAMVRMDAAMRERGLRSRMLLQVHDELVFETDEEELPALAALADEVMEGALPLDPPLEVALKVGTDWENMDRYLRGEDGDLAARPEVGGGGGPRGGGRGDRRAALRLTRSLLPRVACVEWCQIPMHGMTGRLSAQIGARYSGGACLAWPSGGKLPVASRMAPRTSFTAPKRLPRIPDRRKWQDPPARSTHGTLDRCRSCRRSKRSRATCSARWRARGSPMRRCAGTGRSAIRSREQFVAEIRGAQISRVGRRAKSVLIHLADGRVMTVALRMTGALIVAPAGTPDDPYARVVFRLADGRELRYRDVRKFGRIGLWEGGGLAGPTEAAERGRRVADAQAPYRVGDVFGRHGPEPLATTFSAARLAERLRGRAARLKTLLLDQSFVAGVGNIYADEALWRARLHPLRTRRHADAGRGARGCIAPCVPCCGRGSTTAAPASATTSGPMAGRATTPSGWPSTGGPASPASAAVGAIQRIVVGQRSTHFCPRCQKAPEAEGAAGDAA